MDMDMIRNTLKLYLGSVAAICCLKPSFPANNPVDKKLFIYLDENNVLFDPSWV